MIVAGPWLPTRYPCVARCGVIGTERRNSPTDQIYSICSCWRSSRRLPLSSIEFNVDYQPDSRRRHARFEIVGFVFDYALNVPPHITIYLPLARHGRQTAASPLRADKPAFLQHRRRPCKACSRPIHHFPPPRPSRTRTRPRHQSAYHTLRSQLDR